tara:strand:+ start:1764 stop:1961 length:198 start_codon:yes stop_codon:yes gene_type:complete
MSYLQTISFTKGEKGRKVYTEEVIASTPNAAKLAIQNKLGTSIKVTKCMTSVPSTAEGAPKGAQY